MTHIQNINIFISAATSIISFTLAIYSWRRRDTQGASWFAGLSLAVGWMTWCYIFQAATETNLDGYLVFAKLEYVGVSFVPMLWLAFALSFAGRERPLSNTALIGLAVVPLLTIAIVFTNEWHGLFYTQPKFDYKDGAPFFSPDYGAGFWFYVAYAYAIFLAGSVILVRSALNNWKLFRTQAVLTLVATSLPWISNLVDIFDSLNPIPYIYLNIAFLGATLVLFTFAIFRLRLLDVTPLAHDTILHNVPDGIIVTDMKDRVVVVNQTMRSYTNPAVRQPIGQPLTEVFSQYAEQLNVLAGLFEHRGEFMINDRVIDIAISPVKDRKGRLKGRLFVLRDITTNARLYDQTKRQAEELERRVESLTITQHVYEEIGFSFDSAMLIELAFDAILRLTLADAGFVALRKGDDFEITKRYGQYQQDDLERIVRDKKGIITAVLTERHIVTLKQPADILSARANTQAQIAIPLLAPEEGKVEALFGLIVLETNIAERFTEDRTQLLSLISDRVAVALENARLVDTVRARAAELEALYDRVSGLEQLKSDMIRIAAHDLKNPLNVVLGYLELLTQMPDFPHDSRKMYAAMMKSAQRMLQIIQDFLSNDRIEQAAQQQTLESFDLREIIWHAADEFAPRTVQKSQHFQTELPETNCTVLADRAQVYQALTNVISNAIKYTPENGQITVTLTRDRNVARLEVRDNGYGIPEDQQANLFQPYYRVSSKETAAIEGSGIGLHLTKNIIERQGGTLIFHSEYNKGSMFGFTLPLYEPVTEK